MAAAHPTSTSMAPWPIPPPQSVDSPTNTLHMPLPYSNSATGFGSDRATSPAPSALSMSMMGEPNVSDESDYSLGFQHIPVAFKAALSQREFSSNNSSRDSFSGSFGHAPQTVPSRLHSYAQLFNEVNQLQQANRQLQENNLILKTENETLKGAYHTLATSIPQVLSGSIFNVDLPTTNTLTAGTSVTVLQAADYPKVRFWTKQSWTNHVKNTKNTFDFRQKGQPERGKSRAAQGENVTMQYIEDQDGNAVDGHRAAKIREVARSIWAQLASAGKAPKSWKQADITAAEHYRRELRRNFPELGFCELDWKADQIAIEHYPSWRHNHFKEDIVVKEEDAVLSHRVKRSGHDKPLAQLAKRKKVNSKQSSVEVSGIATEKAREGYGNAGVVSSEMETVINSSENGDEAIAQSQALKIQNPLRHIQRPPQPTIPTVIIETPSSPPPAAQTSGAIDNQDIIAQNDDAGSAMHVDDGNSTKHQQMPTPEFVTDPLRMGKDGPGMPINNAAVANSSQQAQGLEPGSTGHAERMENGGDSHLVVSSAGLSGGLPSRDGPPLAPSNTTSIVVAHSSTLDTWNIHPLPSSSTSQSTMSTMVPSAAEAASTSSSGKSKITVFRPGPANTARNICGREWKTKHPRGTASEFKNYYDHVLSAEDKMVYQRRAEEMKRNITAAGEGSAPAS